MGLVDRENCPVCSTPAEEPLYSSPYLEAPLLPFLENWYHRPGAEAWSELEGGHYQLCRCPECGLVFQKQVPDEDLLKTLYGDWIDPEGSAKRFKSLHTLDAALHLAREAAWIIGGLNHPPMDLKVLDFGMGWGAWARMMHGYGCQVSGLDLAGSREQAGESMGLTIHSFQSLGEQKFHLIHAEQVLEHLTEPAKVLKRLRSHLLPGGFFQVGVPYSDDLSRRLKKMDWQAPKGSRNSLTPVHPLEHLNAFSRRCLLRLGREVGLRPVKVSRRHHLGVVNMRTPLRAVKTLLRPLRLMFNPQSTTVVFRRDEDV